MNTHPRHRRSLRRLCALAVLASLALPSLAAPLPEVVRQVLEAHPDVRSARALLKAADEVASQARSAFYPTLGVTWLNADSRDEQLGASIDRNTRRSEAVLSWNLFRGAADVHASRSANEDRDAADADLDSAREQIALRIAEVYLDVLRQRQLTIYSDMLVGDYRRLRDQIEARAQAGRISQADVEQIKVNLIQVETRHALLAADLASAEYRFTRITGLAPEALTLPGFMALEWDQQTLLDAARERNPQLQAALRRVKARTEDIGVARGNLMPSIDLELSKRLSAHVDPAEVSDTVDSTQLSVSIEIPLGGASFSRVSEAAQRREAAQAAADSAMLDIDTRLAPQFNELEQLRRIRPRLIERIKASHRLVDAYALQFDAGRRSLSDLASAHVDRFNAHSDLLNNSVRQFTLEAGLLSLTGELRSALAGNYRPAAFESVAKPQAPTTPPPAAEAPQALKQATGESVASTDFDGAALVARWAAAWSAGDFARYRASYVADFGSARQGGTHEWERERRKRVSRRGIQVGVRELSVVALPDGRMLTSFVQDYRAPAYRDTVNKQLVWIRGEQDWLIERESAD